MKRTLAIAATLLMPVAATGATMNLTCGGLHTVVASPGDALAVVLNVDTFSQQIAAFDGYLSASRPYVLSVNQYSRGLPFEWDFSPTPNGPLDPTIFVPIGGLSFANLGPGIVPLATFNLGIALAWDGVPVRLTVINPLLSDGAGHPVPVDVAPLDIIPEPTSLLLLGMVAVCLRRRGLERRTA